MGGVVNTVGDFLGKYDPVVRAWNGAVDSTDGGVGPGSTVTTLSDDDAHAQDAARAAAQQVAAQQAQQAAHGRAQNYLGSMMPGGPHNWSGSMTAGALPPPPPSQWTYSPGKGPTWQTPERTIDRTATTDQARNWKLTDAKPGSPYGGNRF